MSTPSPGAFSNSAGITSVILALGLAHFLRGAGHLMQARSQVRLSWVPLVWTLNPFHFLLLYAGILVRRLARELWTFFLQRFVLLSPIVSYILAMLLLPDPLPTGRDMRTHGCQNPRGSSALAVLLPLIDAVDTALKGPQALAAQGTIYPGDDPAVVRSQRQGRRHA